MKILQIKIEGLISTKEYLQKVHSKKENTSKPTKWRKYVCKFKNGAIPATSIDGKNTG